MVTITIDVNQDAYDALSDVAAQLGWTAEELAAELTEDTFESDELTTTFMHTAFGWPAAAEVSADPCSGTCGGKGVGYTTVAGACPTPADPAVKLANEKKAKILARKRANAQCLVHGWDCLCTGGTMSIRHSNAKDAKDADGNPTCRYRASAYYKNGTCSTVS
jgi:hypothetical protein